MRGASGVADGYGLRHHHGVPPGGAGFADGFIFLLFKIAHFSCAADSQTASDTIGERPGEHAHGGLGRGRPSPDLGSGCAIFDVTAVGTGYDHVHREAAASLGHTALLPGSAGKPHALRR